MLFLILEKKEAFTYSVTFYSRFSFVFPATFYLNVWSSHAPELREWPSLLKIIPGTANFPGF